MQTHAFADAGFHIPPCPARAQPRSTAAAAPAMRTQARAAHRWLAALGPVREASLVGIVALLAIWGLVELALILQGI
jgi:hypothetical protein